MKQRKSKLLRKTKETNIKIELNVDLPDDRFTMPEPKNAAATGEKSKTPPTTGKTEDKPTDKKEEKPAEKKD